MPVQGASHKQRCRDANEVQSISSCLDDQQPAFAVQRSH